MTKSKERLIACSVSSSSCKGVCFEDDSRAVSYIWFQIIKAYYWQPPGVHRRGGPWKYQSVPKGEAFAWEFL